MLLDLFVVNKASAEERQVRIGLAPTGIDVGNVSSSPVETVEATSRWNSSFAMPLCLIGTWLYRCSTSAGSCEDW